MCIHNLVSLCLFVLKILSKNQILTSIKARNSVANLRKTMIYITNVDLVNDNVYTKFGLNRFICFHDIEQKLNSDPIWSNFELVQDFMVFLLTFKIKEDPINNRGARVFTTLYITF